MDSDDNDLIRRLREAPATPPAPGGATSPAPASAPVPYRTDEAGPARPAANATFVVHDDWGPPPAPPSSEELAAIAATERLRAVGRLALFALAVGMGLAGIWVAWMHLVSDPLAEARVYYDAATRLNLGHALYPAGANPAIAGIYRDPPLLAMVLRPLALLPYQAFALAWELLVVASFGLLVRQLGARSERTWVAIGLLGIPIGWALSIAQAQVPLTLLVAIGQPWSVALAANVTLFPGLIVLWWIGRRDWQATFAFIAWMILLGGAQWILDGTASTAFLRTLAPGDYGDIRSLSPYAISPAAWAVLVGAGVFATLLLARTRWGWTAAVALSTLAPPRLLGYALMTLAAIVRTPRVGDPEEPTVRPISPWRSG
ncbi:MAG TPA: hypothetical protein VNH13_06325 [Candidatus Acidoferrales bacterium]|nr:hypothetical protein [Candidatus Acidoferrales bacterium]